MPSKALTHLLENTKSPWVRIHLDFAGPSFIRKMFLVIVDSYSKRLDDIPISNTKTTLLVECIRHYFATHGLPFVIVTNHGPSFIRNKFKTLIQKNGIKHIFTATYHSSLNSMDGMICSIQKCNKKD